MVCYGHTLCGLNTFTPLRPTFFFFSQPYQKLRGSFTFRQAHTAKWVKSPEEPYIPRLFKSLFTISATSFFQAFHLSWKLRWLALQHTVADNDFGCTGHAGVLPCTGTRPCLFVRQEPQQSLALALELHRPDFIHGPNRPQLYAQASQPANLSDICR